MTPYNLARKKKFLKGKREHHQPWDLKHINPLTELDGELCDIGNYCDLLEKTPKHKEDAVVLRFLAEFFWNKLQ